MMYLCVGLLGSGVASPSMSTRARAFIRRRFDDKIMRLCLICQRRTNLGRPFNDALCHRAHICMYIQHTTYDINSLCVHVIRKQRTVHIRHHHAKHIRERR